MSKKWLSEAWEAHKERLLSGGLAVEYGEIEHELHRCWCCGRDSKRLQKCHIVARSLGGLDTPSNIVPLCSRCHDKAPNALDPNAMWNGLLLSKMACQVLDLAGLQPLWMNL